MLHLDLCQGKENTVKCLDTLFFYEHSIWILELSLVYSSFRPFTFISGPS